MVVITIIGIMFSFLALSFRFSSPEESIETEARRLNQLIQVALEEAILSGEERAIVFKPDSYQFARLAEEEWRPIEDDVQLRKRELPEDMTMELEVENTTVSLTADETESEKNTLKPQVFLLSSGEITPEFSIDMSIFGVDTLYRITGKADGQHSVNSDAL